MAVLVPHLRSAQKLHMRICSSLAYSIFCSLLISVTPGSAQSRLEDKGSEAVVVTVRTIEATDPNNTQSATPPIQSVDSSLSDLRTKLAEVPYQNFRLVSSKSERLCLKKKQSMQLPNGQSLSFRPLYMDGRKVGLWINWRDSDGAGILDTRIHFSADDSVITGTDHAPGIGMLLAIKAEPIVRKSDLMLR